MTLNGCLECLQKQQEIDRLEEENQRLRQKLRYERRKATEGSFGSSTPSAKLPLKANTERPKSERRRGGQVGHVGHGRQGFTADEAARVEEVPSTVGTQCPNCGKALEDKGAEERPALESRPLRAQKVMYRLPKKYCPHCRRTFGTPAPALLPKSLYGNQLLANAAVLHYLQGVPQGRVCEQLGVGPGSLVEIFHRLRVLFAGVPERLLAEYRDSPAKHADETGWRTVGPGGYVWLFATPRLSIFQFHKTRSGRVARAVFGEQPLPGVLVVDRYQGYNKAPCQIQYCYAHLLREVQDLEKEFPEAAEVKVFVSTVAPLLALAMGLRAQQISDRQFYRRAVKLQQQIAEAMAAPAQHLGVRHMQDIFRENKHRLYHWAGDRRVPADNNLAERDLRPTVIARKTSFGSQSDAGALTRGILTTVLHTLKKRGVDVAAHFKQVLDQLAQDMTQDPFPLLFPSSAPNH